MTTENETSTTQRSVHELLKLDTFQGMTDAEIQSLINYYVDLAHSDENVKASQVAAIQSMNEACDAYKALEEDANSVLKKVLAFPLQLGTIDENGQVVS